VTIISENAAKVDLSKRPFRVATTEGKEYLAEALIVATGADAKWLNIESEKRLRGKGVSACATCDGFFFKGKELLVVGGGDTAMEEANFLTNFATKVTVVHRRDQLRASKIMQDRAKKNPKIEFIWDSAVDEVLGDEKVTGVRLKNLKTGETNDFPCGGLFLAIGHKPNTEFLAGQLKLDEVGYIQADERTRTSVEGVFAAGDAMDKRYQQAITAAGHGCMAALEAERWLAEKESEAQPA